MHRENPAPLVSVIIPVYNAGKFLRPAIQSVLAQTWKSLEVIVIDDGSSDGCMESVRDLKDSRIIWMSQANRGKPAALNAALAIARGEFFAVNDADDLSHPARVERLVRGLMDNPDVGGIFSGYSLIIEDQVMAPLAVAKDRQACADQIAAFRMPSHDPTAMFRMSMVSDIRFDETLPVAEGLDFILRVGEIFPMLVLGEALYNYRIHSNSITHTNAERRDRLARTALAKAFERRGRVFAVEYLTDGRARGACDDNNLPAHFIESVCYLKGQGDLFGAIRTGLQCIRRRPLDLHYWKAACLSLTPIGVVARYRNRRHTKRYQRITGQVRELR